VTPGPWTLGWEFVLALVTLLLATFTGWLAWTTRRLARATADEVQGQTRPVLVPARRAVDVAQTEQFPGGEYFKVTIRVRNIGAGPALNATITAGSDSWGAGPVALAPGAEDDVEVSVRVNEGETAHRFTERTSRIRIEYYDLAGHVFATEIGWVFIGFGKKGRLSGVLHVSAGEVPKEAPITGPGLDANPLMAAGFRRRPNRYQLRHAYASFVLQTPGVIPKPLRGRLRAARRALYPKRRQTRIQRMMWGHRAYRATVDKPIRPWVPRLLHRPYVIARGWKWGYLVYRRMY
jgi:hypothetical protein